MKFHEIRTVKWGIVFYLWPFVYVGIATLVLVIYDLNFAP